MILLASRTSVPDMVFRWAIRLSLTCSLLLTIGCGQSQPKPVDADLAATLFQSVLDAWQSGQSIEKFTEGKDSLIIQEDDWTDGCQLVSYEILKSRPRDANLIVEVKLELVSGENETRFSRTREYIVSTHPVKTVFRNLMN